MKIPECAEINRLALQHLQQIGALELLDIQLQLALAMESGIVSVVVDENRLAALVQDYKKMTTAAVRRRRRENELRYNRRRPISGYRWQWPAGKF